MGYLALDQTDQKHAVMNQPITDPGAKWFAESVSYGQEQTGLHENGAVQWIKDAFRTYPYFVRAGQVNGNSTNPGGQLFGFGMYYKHTQPDVAMITHCPIRYHQHSHGTNGTLGWGYLTGNHFMRWSYIGAPAILGNSAGNISLIGTTVRHLNVALGDGHIQRVSGNELQVDSATFKNRENAGLWSANITKWENHGYGVQLVPGGTGVYTRALVDGE
jgi:hypothetical protein